MGLFHSGDISGALIIFNTIYVYIFSELLVFYSCFSIPASKETERTKSLFLIERNQRDQKETWSLFKSLRSETWSLFYLNFKLPKSFCLNCRRDPYLTIGGVLHSPPKYECAKSDPIESCLSPVTKPVHFGGLPSRAAGSLFLARAGRNVTPTMAVKKTHLEAK
jgi:hypothetical protein